MSDWRWLKRELDEAVREVRRWPAWMRGRCDCGKVAAHRGKCAPSTDQGGAADGMDWHWLTSKR